jgi:hypothetical protein
MQHHPQKTIPTNPSTLQVSLSSYREKAVAFENEKQGELTELHSRFLRRMQQEEKLRGLRKEIEAVRAEIVSCSLAKLDERINCLSVEGENREIEFEEALQLARETQLFSEKQ